MQGNFTVTAALLLGSAAALVGVAGARQFGQPLQPVQDVFDTSRQSKNRGHTPKISIREGQG
jgi:hypothetical protein